MVELGVPGESMLHQEVQKGQSSEFVHSKELKAPQNPHHAFLQISFL